MVHRELVPGSALDQLRKRQTQDQLHWVRDMDFDEDRSQVRTASGPPHHGQPPQPGHHHPAANRRSQHRRRPALPFPAAQPPPPDDHELLTDFAEALQILACEFGFWRTGWTDGIGLRIKCRTSIEAPGRAR
jgi:hypothetical protein